MYPQSEILFPYRSIASLKHLRGERWQNLVAQVAAQPDGALDAVAFTLFMIRQCDCLNCDMGSYKASLGCTPCSQRTIASIKLDDDALIEEFEKARQEVQEYLQASPRQKQPRSASAAKERARAPKGEGERVHSVSGA